MRKHNTILAALIVIILSFSASVALAQLSPSTWQSGATGLLADTRTAGLGFQVEQQSWPQIIAWGGVQGDSDNRFCTNGNPARIFPQDIVLGNIKIPGASTPSFSQAGDWSHVNLTFGSALTLHVSRLTPAIMVTSTSSTLRVLTGMSPKYVAIPTTSGIIVQPISGTVSTSAMNANWLLVWYGTNTNFRSTKLPLSQECIISLSSSQIYNGDIPVLITFQNRPTTIASTSEGGVDLTFSSQAGRVSLLPLYGRDVQRSSVTETWSSGLPTAVAQKAQFWYARTCDFPLSARETYQYSASSDTATIGETIQFVNLCAGGTRFAPLPPFLSLARSSLGVAFSGTVVSSGNLLTEFGPYEGIENTNTYSWSITGLGDYANSQRVIQDTGTAPAYLTSKLTKEANWTSLAGHLRPWIFQDSTPVHTSRGMLYWDNPADTLYQLAEIYPAVQDSAVRSQIVSYMTAERTTFPPEDIYAYYQAEGGTYGLETGTVRGEFYSLANDWDYYWRFPGTQSGGKYDRYYHRVPLFNYYGLSKYYDIVGTDSLLSSIGAKMRSTIDTEMRERDWATGYFFAGYENNYAYHEAVPVADRLFAGLIGTARISQRIGDTSTRNISMALLARSAVTRVAMAKYISYLYSSGQVELPSSPSWQPEYSAGLWSGSVWNYNWTGVSGDPRQMLNLSEFGTVLHDNTGLAFSMDYNNVGEGRLIGYMYMTPEVGRLLRNTAKTEAGYNYDVYTKMLPNWYMAFVEQTVADEMGIAKPSDAFGMFNAAVFLKDYTPAQLEQYVDVSWLSKGGDLFYMQKLAESIKAYRGVEWVDYTAWLDAEPPSEIPESIAESAAKPNVITAFVTFLRDSFGLEDY